MNQKNRRRVFLRKDLENRIKSRFFVAAGVSASAALRFSSDLTSVDAAEADTPAARLCQ